MSTSVIRWIAVVLAIVAGNNLAVWLFLELQLSCLHLGARPAGQCSDWWYANHSWVAATAYGVAAFIAAVIIPSLLAPQYKRTVGIVSVAVAVLLTVFTSALWVTAWAVPTLILLSVVSVLLPSIRSQLQSHVA
jgi:hypothetical protein